MQKAVADTKAGDAKARDWVASYVLGKPAPYAFAPTLARAQAELELMAEQERDPVEVEKSAPRHEIQLQTARDNPEQTEPAPCCDGKVFMGITLELCERPGIRVWRNETHEHHTCDLQKTSAVATA